ncbi:hypothetical protein OA93_22185 [Flavobacterium sp. KMS]|uniref:hypothetical protein n=1 Tax=Flavobacterium sp. KMS TaxID=1566023 RepID=UPI00057D1EE1|nr:hypothetical protein [Flavobacterium sp. KMS]KIA93287.1 hypothetical protein OA93_22185 [Flavobacterium sp. KMS]
METILKHIQDLSQSDWDYYFGINPSNVIKNPFLDSTITHNNFIHKYFERGGKVKIFKSIIDDFGKLRYPNHINSVFFLGLLVYYKTGFQREFNLNVNEPGYKTFPFIWFLIALYHDNAYHIEKDNKLLSKNKTLDNLYENYDIQNKLLDEYLDSTSRILFDCCGDYYNYRVNECKVIDHGLFGGIILFDRLVKIRREKSKYQDLDSLFWGEALEGQYKLAAFSIAMHNIWMPEKKQSKLYKDYNLGKLIDFKPLKFNDFGFLYLLGIIDTIDPIKAFFEKDIDEQYIYDNLYLDFTENSLELSCKENSNLDFKILVDKAKSLHGWLDVEVKFSYNKLEIKFK